MNTTQFLQAVDRAITVPNYQPRFTDLDILDLANDEQGSLVVPMLASLREEFFVQREEIAVAANTAKVRIPQRSIGRSLREIQYKSGAQSTYDLPRISIEDAVRLSSNGTGTPYGFSLEGDYIRLLPTPSAAGTLITYILQKPSDLVLSTRTALITAVGSNTLTLSQVPSNLTIGSKIDITNQLPSYPIIYKDLEITNINGNQITLAGVTTFADIGVNDVVSTAKETSVIQLPLEATNVLVDAVAVKVLEALSIPDQMKIAEEKLQQKIRAVKEIFAPRVEGAVPKIIDRSGLLRGRATVRRFPGVSIP